MNAFPPLKSPLTYDEQIQHLEKEHGLTITDYAKAQQILKSVNYYRLSAYGIGLMDRTTDRYVEGTDIEHLYSLYLFDSRLRNAISPVIESVEIKLRSCIAYHLAIHHGAECYMDRSFFDSWTSGVTGEDMYTVFIKRVKTEIEKQRKKPMVIHHNQKYGGHFPIWVVVELISLGTLSTLYSLMKPEDQTSIAKEFHTSRDFMRSWFAAFVELRNICAHYGRLYNMPLDSLVKLPKKEKIYANRRLFSDCLALKYIMQDEPLWRTFLANLSAIIDECPLVNLSYIGFPDHWDSILQ